MKLSRSIVSHAITQPGMEDRTEQWYDSIQAAVDKYIGDDPEEVAAFLVILGRDSKGLMVFSDDDNIYMAQRLAERFPTRFATDTTTVQPQPNEHAKVLAAQMQNGDFEGVKEFIPDYFPERGAIRLKSQADWEGFCSSAGLDPKDTPLRTLENPSNGAAAAAYAFKQNSGDYIAELKGEGKKDDKDQDDEQTKKLKKIAAEVCKDGSKPLNKEEALQHRFQKVVEAIKDQEKVNEKQTKEDEHFRVEPLDTSNADNAQLKKQQDEEAAMNEGYNKALNINGDPATGNDLAPQTPANEAEAAQKTAEGSADNTGDVAAPPAPKTTTTKKTTAK